jgi:hypothetical protein
LLESTAKELADKDAEIERLHADYLKQKGEFEAQIETLTRSAQLSACRIRPGASERASRLRRASPSRTGVPDRAARQQLKSLRTEARSASHFKEVTYKLENKVVELTPANEAAVDRRSE